LHDVQGVGARVTKGVGARVAIHHCMIQKVARVATHYCMVHKVWVQDCYSTCNITYVCFRAKGWCGPVMDMVQLRTSPDQSQDLKTTLYWSSFFLENWRKQGLVLVLVLQKKAKKTGLDWTFELYG
jgi:hypothetical protein